MEKIIRRGRAIRERISGEESDPSLTDPSLILERLGNLGFLIQKDESVRQLLRRGFSIHRRKWGCVSPDLAKFFSGEEGAKFQLEFGSLGFGGARVRITEVGRGTAIFGIQKGTEPVITFVPDPAIPDEISVQIQVHLEELWSRPREEQIRLVGEATNFGFSIRSDAFWAVYREEKGPGSAGGGGGN